MARPAPLSISDDLTLAIGAARITLSPRQGLELAEQLARKSFRRAMSEEAEAERQEQART